MLHAREHTTTRKSCQKLCRLAAVICVPGILVAVGCSSEDGERDAQDAGSPEDAKPLGPCFQEHLEEAIALNESRRPKYSMLTEGRSEAISDTLIDSEKMSLLFAPPIDEAAEPFHEAGVRIVCDEFVSMSEAPAFSDRFAFDPEPIASFEPVDGNQLTDDLKLAFTDGGFVALSEYADASLSALETPQGYHCMLRHMLESLRRIANLAPVHDARAREAGLDGALAISEEMVRLHFLTIGPAAKLDEQAAQLHAEGVPILCQDVPSIPAGP